MAVRYQRATDLVELTGILQTTATGLSIDEIADRFDVSRRTAERMLSALRERFPDLQPHLRAGRKYWKLPGRGQARPLQLPRTLHALSERIEELELEVLNSRGEIEELRGIAEGVFSTSPVGLLLLDAGRRIVWVNGTLSRYLGLAPEVLVGLPLETAARDRLTGVLERPEDLLGDQEDGRSDCRVLPGERRRGRWLRPVSRSIRVGRYAGGRLDRYMDVTGLHPDPSRQPEQTVGLDQLPESTAPMLKEHMQTLLDAVSHALDQDGLAPEVARRLRAVTDSNARTISTSLDMISSSGMKYEPIAPKQTLEVAATLVRPFAEECGVELRVEAAPVLPSMMADRALVISNLVLNAKLTVESLPPGSHLILRADHLEEPARVRISVIDDGPSLPDGFPEIVADFLPTQSGGAGIGLASPRDGSGRATGGIVQYFELPAFAIGSLLG